MLFTCCFDVKLHWMSVDRETVSEGRWAGQCELYLSITVVSGMGPVQENLMAIRYLRRYAPRPNVYLRTIQVSVRPPTITATSSTNDLSSAHGSPFTPTGADSSDHAAQAKMKAVTAIRSIASTPDVDSGQVLQAYTVHLDSPSDAPCVVYYLPRTQQWSADRVRWQRRP